MEMLLGLVVMAGVPAYFVVQPATLWRWPGGWRIAALAPLLLTVPALVFSLFALHHGSNLWPLTLIFAAAVGNGRAVVRARVALRVIRHLASPNARLIGRFRYPAVPIPQLESCPDIP